MKIEPTPGAMEAIRRAVALRADASAQPDSDVGRRTAATLRRKADALDARARCGTVEKQ